MPDLDYPYFITTELDPDLLTTPFKVRTNWHVITGAPSSGKTTLINLMNEKGFKTSPERARQYIEMEVAKGHSLNEVQNDLADLNRAIMAFTLNEELNLPPNDVLFLDRGVPDSLSYCRIVGINPNEFLIDCLHRHYASVFILERLPFHHDGIRYEDDAIADFLHTWTMKDYSALSYNPILVPVMSLEDRLKFVLENLSENGLISL